MSQWQELLAKIYFNDYTTLLKVESFEAEYYEKLQKEYKKLMSEYQDLTDKNCDVSLINDKLEELKEKQQEIHQEFSKFEPKNNDEKDKMWRIC